MAAYVERYVERSVVVEPLPGETIIGPGEAFIIRLTATNDPFFSGAGSNVGVRLVNVRWHVTSGITTTANLVVRDAPLDAREGPTNDLPLLNPGDHVSEMYVFPRGDNRRLEPGETDTIEVRSIAQATGTIQIYFDLVADFDTDWLGMEDQGSYPRVGAGGRLALGPATSQVRVHR